MPDGGPNLGEAKGSISIDVGRANRAVQLLGRELRTLQRQAIDTGRALQGFDRAASGAGRGFGMNIVTQAQRANTAVGSLQLQQDRPELGY